MNILVTGATGFVGSHLLDFLLSIDDTSVIFASKRHRSNMDNVRHLLGKERIRWLDMDITDSYSVTQIVENARPDYCFHLCAQSFVPASWNAPQETINTNVIGTINLLEAIRKVKPECKVQIAGSSEEYGFVKDEELPIKESNPLRPLSPYGVSKVGTDLLGYQYHRSYRLAIIRTRGFNHTGPRRGEVFVCSNFAKQIVEIEKGKREPVIRVGNLEAKRDFTDVRDMVRAYWLSLEKGENGAVYNICSGRAYSMHEVLNILLGFSSVNIEVKEDPDRMRPSDVPVLVGDNTTFCQRTGWSSQIPFERTMEDLIEFWRERISRGSRF